MMVSLKEAIMTAEELIQEVINRLTASLQTDFMSGSIRDIMNSSVADLDDALEALNDG
tara:strand:+ start:494 stop:667 length:174 start_codon:yes stop_codon:yes gene_type:complete